MKKKEILSALEELKKEKERNFDQTVDLIVNLKNIDLHKNSLNTWITVPNKIKEPKVAGFFHKKNKIVDTIKKSQFSDYDDKKKIKKLAKKYDFFLASGDLMKDVASTFGRYLGPRGKMPSPNLGVVQKESDDLIKKIVNKCGNTIRVRTKTPSVKFAIGKEDMDKEKIAENIISAYNSLLKELPNKKNNVKSVLVKLTMTKPIKLEK